MVSRLSISAGVIGFFIGVVMSLARLGDYGSIGPRIAISLLTALYGVIFSELIIQPLKHALLNKQDSIASD